MYWHDSLQAFDKAQREAFAKQDAPGSDELIFLPGKSHNPLIEPELFKIFKENLPNKFLAIPDLKLDPEFVKTISICEKTDEVRIY